MSKSYIPVEIRRYILEEAKHRCGYCQTQKRLIGQPMVFDHLIPESKGGETTVGNLWLACRRCNEFKGVQTSAIDPLTGERANLFNPRLDSWGVHFAWTNGGIEIVGLSAIGRATVIALRMNNADIVGARSLWVQVGWHPPNN